MENKKEIKPTELLRWRKISVFLSGNTDSIRRTYLDYPKNQKYKELVIELMSLISEWMNRAEEIENKQLAGGVEKKHIELVCRVAYRYGRLTGYPIGNAEESLYELGHKTLRGLSKIDDDEKFKSDVKLLMSNEVDKNTVEGEIYYIGEKIESIDNLIAKLHDGIACEEWINEIKEAEKEKQLLESILNKLTMCSLEGVVKMKAKEEKRIEESNNIALRLGLNKCTEEQKYIFKQTLKMIASDAIYETRKEISAMLEVKIDKYSS